MNSRPYGKNPNRDWHLKNRVNNYASSLAAYDKDDVEQTPEEQAKNSAPPASYPGYNFVTKTLLNPVRFEEFILWLIDPYETSYGTGYYSPVRISEQLASFIKSHNGWDKVCVIEQSKPYTQTHVTTSPDTDEDDVTVISEPAALWLWRRKDWLACAENLAQEKQRTDAERAEQDRIAARYITVVTAMRKRYSAMTFEIAMQMVKEWEAVRGVDENAAKFLRFYGWYEFDTDNKENNV